uniref:Uncharacterized protein n=1 Tax=Vitis vinifera TaxID=29760 RepID=F6HVT5_VITVI
MSLNNFFLNILFNILEAVNTLMLIRV